MLSALAAVLYGVGRAGELPPLKVDQDAPLLLDDPAPASQNAAHPALPKLICYDCHGNLREESLSVQHAKGGTTCVDCHGESHDHAEDEGNLTPPEIMFARGSIGRKCRECHPTHDAPAAEVVTRWQKRGLQKLPPKDLVCTDCHGQHRLKVRTIRWDKTTGKLQPERARKSSAP